MLHNVTVKHEENKLLEEFWVMRAVNDIEIVPGKKRQEWQDRELNHEPAQDEIAQFLYESHADFVSVVKNYRFAGELPF